MKKIKIIGIILAVFLGIGIIGSLGNEENIQQPETSSYSDEQITENNNLNSNSTEKSENKSTITTTTTATTTITTKETTKTNAPVGSGSAKPVQSSKLPVYSGKPYVAINNNIPNFSSAELTTKAYEKYSPLDSLGRCGVATASCGKEIMPGANEERGSISSIKPSGWNQAKYNGISGGYLWNRCHLIGWQLSAENANRKNLITGTRYMNINGMLPFENMVADYIKETGNHVAYRVTPIYQGNNLVCSGVQIEAYSVEDNGEGICFNVYCFNVQPNITINYANGSSSDGSTTTTTTKKVTTTKKETTTKKVTTTKAPTTTKKTTTTKYQEPQGGYVWIPKSGSKYHSHSGCSNMKGPSKVTEAEAKSLGYTRCSKCW
ncbi:MAG: DNA/RNA non-specific endonuclease [Clostridia bacterium]|nr:DNA/RNA non-specific endonuclease [Clostridia bacterium]